MEEGGQAIARKAFNAMRTWRAQPIEKSREMKLAAQKAIDDAKDKAEKVQRMEQEKKKHAEVMAAANAALQSVGPDVKQIPCDGSAQVERFMRIYGAVCKELAVDPLDVRSNMRHPRLVAARRVTIHLARLHTMLSFPDIQSLMGKSRTSHSTAIGSSQWIQKRMDKRIFEHDERTFGQMVAAFDPVGLCFKEVGT